jgi:hypothetical protein
LVVSVLPVPAGPAGAPPMIKCSDCNKNAHINADSRKAAQLAKKFQTLYTNANVITMFTTAQYLSLS